MENEEKTVNQGGLQGNLGGKKEKNEFYKKLSHASDEESEVQGYYRDEIARVLPYVSDIEGLVTDEKPSMNSVDKLNLTGRAKSDGIYDCSCYISNSNSVPIQKPFMIMLEAKYDVDFNNLDERAKVILQAYCYLKLISENGITSPVDKVTRKQLPAVLVLGSKVNCGAISVSVLTQVYPPESTNFYDYKTPSRAWENPNNAGFLDIIKVNENINKYFILREVENGLYDLCNDIIKFAIGANITQDVSDINITKAYQRFDNYVLYKRKKKDPETGEEYIQDIPFNLKRKVFLSLILAKDSDIQFVETRSAKGEQTYKERIKINFHGDILEVNHRQYDTFKLLYSLRTYSPAEKEIITAVADRLIKEDSRRKRGDYYTPEIWVDEAYKLLDQKLGSNWKDKYVVWDCAWGTGNLTRNQFILGKDKDLYCSTIRGEDIEISDEAGYNPKATKFIYDFLNDDILLLEEMEDALKKPLLNKRGINVRALDFFSNFSHIEGIYSQAIEKGMITEEEAQAAVKEAKEILYRTELYRTAHDLIDTILGWNGKEKKQLVFVINPPYKGAGSGQRNNNVTEISNSYAAGYMQLEGISCSNQLYAQFLWRICRLNRQFGGCVKAIGLFSPVQILNGVSFRKLRDLLKSNKLAINDGFYFPAGEFSDVSNNWPISFTVWMGEEANHIVFAKENVIDSETGNDHIETICKNDFTPISSERSILNWIKCSKTKSRKVYIPRFTSAFNYDTTKKYARAEDSLGVLMVDQDIIESNDSRVIILQSRTNANWTILDIAKDNFDNVIAMYVARKLIRSTWATAKNKYMIPDINHENYQEYLLDAIVYSIFSVDIASLRDVTRDFNLYNEFFWVSKEDMYRILRGELQGDIFDQDVLQDLIDNSENERYVYQRLKGQRLSKEATDVLSLATTILFNTIPYRKDFNIKNPRCNINSWDAGWPQILRLAETYQKEGLKALNSSLRTLENKMRPLVYELGFLYK